VVSIPSSVFGKVRTSDACVMAYDFLLEGRSIRNPGRVKLERGKSQTGFTDILSGPRRDQVLWMELGVIIL
jgi:hypothetical protein